MEGWSRTKADLNARVRGHAGDALQDFDLWRRAIERRSSGSACARVLLEPGVEEVGGFCFVAGEKVAVAVEGNRDRGVAHVGAEGFAVDAGGDHVGSVAVAAFVHADRRQPGSSPSFRGVQRERDLDPSAVDVLGRCFC